MNNGSHPVYLIVDDERLARTELARMIGQLPSPATVLEAASADAAGEVLLKGDVDALFLDIEMPGGSGFDLLESLGKSSPPVIFTTAYSEFAARAFEIGAVDYLLKPFDQKRLLRAVGRLDENGEAVRYGDGDRLLLKIDGECILLPVSSIIFLESLGREGTLVHWGTSLGRARQTLKQFAARLDPKLFFQASRETIVNLNSLRDVSESDGCLTAFMSNGAKVEFSRRQSRILRQKAGS